MSTKIGLISLGCSKNLVDSEHMLAKLRGEGFAIVSSVEEADVAIINTCGFIEAAKREAIETILETAQLKTTGHLRGLIVTGCLAQRYREDMRKELPEVDAILGTGSYDQITQAVWDVCGGRRREYFADTTAAALEGERERLTPSYTAYFKIAEGCSNRCAYCIIPKLRGPFRSRSMPDLLAEAQSLSDTGVRELIVIAQDITRFGMDITGRRLLPELLRALCQMDFTWIRLHYLYPDQITEDLVEVLASQPKIVKYLDIPLQHVSTRILRSMHRPGSREEFLQLIRMLRARIPGLVLRTSLIVGLPGETEEEFDELCAFLREARIERAGVFEYSPEEGTEAAAMPDQIDDETKARRRLTVEELQSEVMDEYNRGRTGQTLTVLCEGFDGESCYGRTYADSIEVDGQVYFTAVHRPAAGEFVQVHIDGSLGADLCGTMTEG